MLVKRLQWSKLGYKYLEDTLTLSGIQMKNKKLRKMEKHLFLNSMTILQLINLMRFQIKQKLSQEKLYYHNLENL